MALQPQKLPRQLPLPPFQHLDHGNSRVVVADPPRHAAEELEGPAVPLQKGLRAFPRKYLEEDRSRVGQRHHKQGNLDLLAPQQNRRFAEVDLGLAWRMRERQKDFPVSSLPGPHRVFHHGLATRVSMLISQPLEYPLRRVLLLARRLPVGLQDLMNDRQERLQFPLPTRLAQPVARWLLMGQDLLQRMPAQSVLLAGGSLAQLVRQHLPTNLLPELHVASHFWASLRSGTRSGLTPLSCQLTGLLRGAPPISTAATRPPRRRFQPPSTRGLARSGA